MDMNFRERVRRAYEMEVSEIPFYAALAEMAPNEALRESIIIMQERQLQHANYLASLLSQEMRPFDANAQQVSPRPRSFVEGLRQAQMDELEQIRVFAGLVMDAPTPAIRARLITIMWDQMQDLVFFAHTYNVLTASQGGMMGGYPSSPVPPVINY